MLHGMTGPERGIGRGTERPNLLVMSNSCPQRTSIRGIRAHYCEAGAGPVVLCIHSVASSGAQWRPLMDRLKNSYRVLAVDLYGDGQSPPCPVGRDFSIEDEIALIKPILSDVGCFHLVAHSYGACVAVKMCLSEPERVSSLVLYEPALWGTFAAYWPDDPGSVKILALRAETGRLVELGDCEAAAEKFLDYWAGAGTWAAMPESKRASLVPGTVNGNHKWKPNLGPVFSPEVLNSLNVPTFVLTGSQTSEIARRLMNRLRESVPRWRIVELEGLGHMGPITHPGIVNEQIAMFLEGLRSCSQSEAMDRQIEPKQELVKYFQTTP
jgi:pimeloyl-ACP methyl ester carboxylesterase